MGNLGDLSPEGSVAVGVIVGLISTSLQAIGLTLQRKSHLLEDEKHPYDVRRPPYKRRRWQVGMGMFVISNIVGSTIQITTLPLPVLSTLQASGLVFNTIFATLILGEPFTRYSLAGTVLVCIGALLIGTFGAIGEPAHTLDQLLYLLQRRPFLLWMGATTLLVVVVLVGIKLLKHLVPSSRAKPSASGHFSPHFLRLQSRMRLIRGMSYGFVSGILSAHSLLLAKSAVELLVRTVVDGVNQFNRWQSWAILLGMIFLALTQLFYLHRGLKLCSTSVLYPFVFCIYNIIAIMDGLIYFRQVSQLAGLHAGLIALGTMILLGGVLCLSWRLEDIDNHAAVTTVGPTQTGLGPGMALVEEHSPSSPGLLDGQDEESQIGECEPLLNPKTHTRHLSYQRGRAPSLPLNLNFGRDSVDLNPASIWAELDDSDYESTAGHTRSSTDHRRSTSGSATLNGPLRGITRNSTVGATPHDRERGSRRAQGSLRGNQWHRTSAPQSGLSAAHRKRRGTGGLLTSDQEVGGYGTIQEDGDDTHWHDDPPILRSSDASSGLLVGPKRAVADAWKFGRQYLSRWSSPQAGNQAGIDPENDSSSSLLPHSAVPLPRTRYTQGTLVQEPDTLQPSTSP
ncbi:Magnesium transporter NIPA [Penicillium concentricum]|uniref:Magnesium transporter NIPA n=1 Tax=Penicillium concentricum TaxID=293559 RepID=A0A9W9V1Q2_9EURO|nr:Magnesium transporter NIPA [Penicillium concentricum]KAJ5365573.1 Magnesium transporter NIPA [Penicillium concentricum]